MELRDKVAHLHRRLGFGLPAAELDEAVKLGLDRNIQRLVRYETAPELDITPWEFCWRGNEEADLGAWRMRAYWGYRLLTTPRPLEEKLTLFWHSHFAVSDSKVEDGPMMLYYLENLRRNASGPFEMLLIDVSKEPALMRYLDMTRSERGDPNENFSREVLELFTLGEGNYTEQDVKEVARALTGWGFVHHFWELPGNSSDKLRLALRYQRPFASFAYLPAWHDPGPKTILGKTKNWEGEETLRMLAAHPKTAEHVCGKLWQFFAGTQPDAKAIGAMVSTWRRTKGNIREVVTAMAKHPGFYSPAVVGRQAKNPVDFCVPMARRQGIGQALAKMRAESPRGETPIVQKVLDDSAYLVWRMERMGLNLLYPTNVAGWTWGDAFITPAMMAERFQYIGHHIPQKDTHDVATQNVMTYVTARKPTTDDEVIQAFAAAYDVVPTADTVESFRKICTWLEPVKKLSEPSKWPEVHYVFVRFLSAAPEFHVQ